MDGRTDVPADGQKTTTTGRTTYGRTDRGRRQWRDGRRTDGRTEDGRTEDGLTEEEDGEYGTDGRTEGTFPATSRVETPNKRMSR